jgi:hypothetical protein
VSNPIGHLLIDQSYLKGPWHEIFDLWFFSSNNSP